MRLTSVKARQLMRDGYVPLRRAVPAPFVRAALREIRCLLSESNQKEGAGSFLDNEWMRACSAPAVMDLLFKTRLWGLVDGLCGGALKPPDDAFVYLRFPQRARGSGSPNFHVDGVHSPTSGTPPGVIGTQTVKLCVLLSDLPGRDRGNFTVLPGSHRLLERHLRERGPGLIKRGLPALAWPSPVQLLGRAGDAFLCHQMLLHEGEQNLSAEVRYAVFFNMRHVDHERRWERVMTDLWLEWPGVRAGARRELLKASG